MKDIRIFGADFERSKRIVTQGDFALTAGMPNPIHMGIINRLFTVIILGFCFSGILIYGVLIGIPEFIGVDSDVHVISLEAGMLIHNMSSFLKPFNLTVYAISYLGMVLVFWPKKRLTSQLWTYFPFYFAMSICAFISGLYFASAVAYDAYTWMGFWLELGVGIALFFWIILNSIQNLKRRLNDQEEKSILKQLVRILAGTAAVLFPVSLVYHLLYQVPLQWYFYILGLFLPVWFVIGAHFIAFMINVHIFQAYYIHKYPEEYKAYLKISDREWYSKRYYKKLVKSGQLQEETM